MNREAREYWRTWFWRTATTKVMTVCIIIWAILFFGLLISPPPAGTWIYLLFAVPGNLQELAHCPWTPLTYMFAHINFIHMAMNMLWWLMYGEIYEQIQGSRRLMALYLYGGLAGAAAFIAFPFGSNFLIGASCSVMAVMGAVVAIEPNHKVNLLIFGPVNIIWTAVVATLFFVMLAPSASESIAHGAALMVGIVTGLLRRRGVDATRPMTALFDFFGRIFSPGRVARPTTNLNNANDEDLLDELLEKVSRSGYGSLSPGERQKLFDLSQRFKNHR